MKARSFLILAGLSSAVIVAGLLQQAKVRRLTAEYQVEEDRAVRLGLTADSWDISGLTAATASHRRDDGGARTHSLLQELPAVAERGPLALHQALQDLTASDLKGLCAALADDHSELDPDMRINLVRALVQIHAVHYPEMMLGLYASSPAFYSGQAGAPYLVASGLKQWAVQSPAKAIAWARATNRQEPALITSEAWLEILAGASRTDPAQALSLVTEFHLDDDPRSWSRIGEGTRTAEEWTGLLSASRRYAAENPGDDVRRHAAEATLQGMSRILLGEGFDDATRWLAAANLTPEETAIVAGELHPWYSKAESGRWLDWLGENLSGAPLGEKTAEIMAEWTRKDYAAAGAWLNGKPEGPLRDAAILGYADALAPYDPATASSWALLLPGGEQRTEVARKIYDEWKAKDPASAAGFARQAGLAAP